MLAAWSTCAGPHLSGRLEAGADDVPRRLVHVAGRSGCRRCRARTRGSARVGSALAAITASIRAGSCTVTRSSSVASGAGTRGSRLSTPSCSASEMVRSTRTGFIGCVGPEVVGGERLVVHHAGAAGRLVHAGDATRRGCSVLTRGRRRPRRPRATTSNSPLSERAAANPRQARTGAGGHPRSKAIHSTSSNSEAGTGGPSGADGVADEVELGAQRDPAAEVVGGGHPAAVGDLVEHLVDRRGARRRAPEVGVPDLGEASTAAAAAPGVPTTASAEAHVAEPSVQQARALDHRGDGDRHQDGVVLVPGVPVGLAARRGTASRRWAAPRAAASVSAAPAAPSGASRNSTVRTLECTPSKRIRSASPRAARGRTCRRSPPRPR